MSAPTIYVRRDGQPGAAVAVALELWTSSGPVRGDCVVFFDRPIPFPERHPEEHGLASGDGHEWVLVEPGVEETWRFAGEERVRMRLFLLDSASRRVVGAYYWLTAPDGAKPSSPEG